MPELHGGAHTRLGERACTLVGGCALTPLASAVVHCALHSAASKHAATRAHSASVLVIGSSVQPTRTIAAITCSSKQPTSAAVARAQSESCGGAQFTVVRSKQRVFFDVYRRNTRIVASYCAASCQCEAESRILRPRYSIRGRGGLLVRAQRCVHLVRRLCGRRRNTFEHCAVRESVSATSCTSGRPAVHESFGTIVSAAGSARRDRNSARAAARSARGALEFGPQCSYSYLRVAARRLRSRRSCWGRVGWGRSSDSENRRVHRWAVGRGRRRRFELVRALP